MEVAARITVRVAFMTAMSAVIGCGAHASTELAKAPLPPTSTNAETTAATIAIATPLVAPAGPAPSVDARAASAVDENDDEFDEMPLFKRPTTFKELLELIAASADVEKTERH